MEAKELSPELWSQFPINSNRGFNPLVVIEKAVEGVFPWAKVSFFSAEDLDDRMATEGYVVLTPAHWSKYGDWNKNVAIRYGLSEKDGGLKWKELFVCVRPKDLDAKRQAYVMEESEKRYAVAADAKAREIAVATGAKTGSSSQERYSPADPATFNEGNEDEAETDATTNAGQAPVRRGRPPKGG